MSLVLKNDEVAGLKAGETPKDPATPTPAYLPMGAAVPAVEAIAKVQAHLRAALDLTNNRQGFFAVPVGADLKAIDTAQAEEKLTLAHAFALLALEAADEAFGHATSAAFAESTAAAWKLLADLGKIPAQVAGAEPIRSDARTVGDWSPFTPAPIDAEGLLVVLGAIPNLARAQEFADRYLSRPGKPVRVSDYKLIREERICYRVTLEPEGDGVVEPSVTILADRTTIAEALLDAWGYLRKLAP